MKVKFNLLFAFCLLASPGFAQWSPNNTAACSATEHQKEVRLVTDGQGGAILTWVDYRFDGQNGDVYAQRLNQAGVAQWTLNGVGVCTELADQGAVSIVEDGAGGAILCWNDWRSGNRDIYAQKVDASGNSLWTVNGVGVAVKVGEQQDSKLIADGAGGAIIVWQDSTASGIDVYAQRINASGVAMWTTDGIVICNAVGSQINPRLESDGAGGAIFTWQDKRSASSYDIYAQRINAGGQVQWAANGVVVANGAATQSNPKIEPDGAGGAYIAWQDKRSGTFDVYAQRLNSAGTPQWTANGLAVCTNAGSQAAVDLTAKGGINGTVIVWRDDRSGIDAIYAQRIDPSGVAQWTANGLAIATSGGAKIKPNIVGDGSGNAHIVWQDSVAGSWDIMAAKVSAAGTLSWSATISAMAGDQSEPKNVTDGSGGCIYAWQDRRNLVDDNIYAHHLYADGTMILGRAEAMVSPMLRMAPNPMTEEAVLFLELEQPEVVQVELLDARGKVVAEVLKADLPSGANQVNLSRSGLSQGWYLCRVRGNGWQQQVSLLVL